MAKESKAKEREKLYLIHFKGFVGNCVLFWNPDGKGYTTDVDKAWRVPLEEAKRICSTRPDQDFPRAAALVDKLATRHVTDVFRLEKGR